MSSAAEYFTQQKEVQELTQNNNDTRLILKRDELDEYDDLQRELLGSSWTLLRQYHLPDSYRLTQNALAKFSGAMNEEDPSKRQRMMKYFEGDFAMYAPYWFYRAKAADEAGDSDEAGISFAKFGEVWRPVLRKDPYRAEAMKYRIETLMITRENTDEILKCLDEMRANTELEDWANNILAGMVYFSLGYRDKAEECVMCNVDFDFEREVSSRLLEDMKTTELPLKDDEFMALFDDVKSIDTKKIEAAIINGANVNAKNKYSDTALMLVAKNGRTDVAELLLKHGANVNAKGNYGNYGYTALMYAAYNGHTGAVEILLKHGANVNAKDISGNTALMKAAYNGHTGAVEILLKHGADVNAKNDIGFTPLMWVAGKGYADIAEVLIKHGADVNAKGIFGDTALKYAGDEFAQLLRKYGAEEEPKKGFFARLFG